MFNIFCEDEAVKPKAILPLSTSFSISSLFFMVLGEAKVTHLSLPNNAIAIASAPPDPVSLAMATLSAC